jgi:hypothetical protein
MNPLRPPTLLLRRIARIVAEVKDPKIRAWADALDLRFSRVSIVKTYRGGRLCGYEVWRHLATAAEDPRRHKARLWFGIKHWRSEFGYDGAALDMARRAARRMRAMNRRELAAWWKQCTRRHRPTQLPEYMLEVRLDYTESWRMSQAFARFSRRR